MRKICILTIVDSIATTSMPINEFVLYREKKRGPYRQILIVCSKHGDNKVVIPHSIFVYYVGNNWSAFRQQLKAIKKECAKREETLICHLHAPKSALSFFFASIGLQLRKHTLYTIHSTYNSRDIKYRISSCLSSLLAKYSNCVSHASYNGFSLLVKWLKGDRITTILNGVDYERISQATSQLPSHQEVANMHKLVCVGRMIPIKNQQFLVKLLKYLPDTELLLIGNNDDKIRHLAIEEGVESRVNMTGLLPRDEVFQRLNECGIYVSSSLVEGMPISVLEAMYVGLIPILSDITAHQEVSNTCKLFNTIPLIEDDWVLAISTYQQMGEKELIHLSSNIRNSVLQNFSLDEMHRQYNCLYEKLI